MVSLHDALRGAQSGPAKAGRRPAAIVAGAGGTLGSAVLEQALSGERFGQVSAVVTGPLTSALRGLKAVAVDALAAAEADTGFIVFERARHANGRDEAFVRPQPQELLSLAGALHAAGVRRLLVVVPHAPALLPQALKAGLATLDEAAVAALGFEQLVFVRAATTAGAGGAVRAGVERFVDWWLSQLRWMVPQAEQPVRSARLAELVVQLALRLPQARPGTRVLPPEVLAQAAPPGAADAVLDAWLGRRRALGQGGASTDNRAMPAPLANDNFLRACLRQPTDHTPIWLMRQAGRYLPEYRASRERAGSFMGLATNPDDATEVTLQPLERYPLDAAILFSDILTVPDAMGLGLSFAVGEGPRFAHPLRDEAAVMALRVPDLNQLRYVFDAVAAIRKALAGRVPLIGFSGSPWTLACYMVEGAGSDDYRLVKTMLYARPDLMHHILAVNTEAVTAYLNAQIDAGAQAVMLFDSWGGVLADGAYQAFSLAYLRRVVQGLQREAEGRQVPVIVFTKGGGLWLEEIAAIGADVVGLDWTVALDRARARVGDRVALQGNLDPNVLFAPPEVVAREATAVLDRFGPPQRNDGGWDGHVFNLGHGISQFTPPEHVSALVEAVHAHSRRQRGASRAPSGK